MDNVEEIRFPEYPHGFVTVKGIQYEVELGFTAKDFERLIKVNISDTDECLAFVRNLIITHTIGDVVLNSEDIDEICCDEYIEQCLSVNGKLSDIYSKLDAHLHKSNRFLVSQRNYFQEMIASISSISDSLCESIVDMAKSFSYYVDLMVSEVSNTINNALSVFNESLINTLKHIGDLIVDLPIHQISEEEIKRIEDRYELWGLYGWTSTEFVNTEILDQAPLDIDDANAIAKRVMNNNAMAILFERIDSLKTIKHSDFVELKKCFDTHNYKACVLLAFSMIDSAIVHSQGKLRRNSEQNRKPGYDGMKKIMKKYRFDDDSYYLLSANLKNLYSCLCVVFKSDRNFENQPKIINRHFVVHGTLHRKVIRRDAIQVLLLLFNICSYLEIMGIVNNDADTES